jgi:UDP-N-acetylglucosamine 1-carboxyvinyltransferase
MVLSPLGGAVEQTTGERLREAGVGVPDRDSRGDRQGVRALLGPQPAPALVGPLLNRVGEAVVAMVGGCRIGQRPVDFRVAGLAAMGAEITVEGSTMVAKARRLVGCRHRLPYPSVGATENLILEAVRAKETTVIENAAIEPEIADLLLLLLQKMGAHVAIEVDRRIVIEGVDRLYGAEHHVIADRIEAASYAAAAVAAGADVEIVSAEQVHLMTWVVSRLSGCQPMSGRSARRSLTVGISSAWLPSRSTAQPW